MTKEEVEDNWLRLNKDVDLILNRREGVILIGDLVQLLGILTMVLKRTVRRSSIEGN